jgi:alpha-N-arabinofuranosidase
VVAGFLNSFIRHADVVKMANIAQIVNVIAPLMTRENGLLVQSTFYPFEMMSRRRAGVSLEVGHDGPVYQGKTNGTVPVIDSSAILNGRELSVFMTNRSLNEAAEVSIDIADRTVAALASGEVLGGPGPKAENTWEAPDVVRSRTLEGVTVKKGTAAVELPPLSFAAATFRLE